MKVQEVNGKTFVVLSRRNLRTLLAKLDGHPPDSACTIVGGQDADGFFVQAQEDDVHYADRPGPVKAGPMHPDTERQLGGGAAMGNSLNIDLEGKVVIFRRRYMTVEPLDHPFLVGGGFGANPHTIGRALFGEFLSDGEHARMEGYMVERLATDEEIARFKRDETTTEVE